MARYQTFPLAGLCRLKLPSGCRFEGISLAPLLAGREQPELARRMAVVQYGGLDPTHFTRLACPEAGPRGSAIRYPPTRRSGGRRIAAAGRPMPLMNAPCSTEGCVSTVVFRHNSAKGLSIQHPGSWHLFQRST
jgi:hypothetical protein